MAEKFFTHTLFPAHWLNASPRADWVDFIRMTGGVNDEDPHEVSDAEANEIFSAALADGTLAEMSEEEAKEANAMYRSTAIPSMRMSRVDWIEAVWDTDESLGKEEDAVALVANMIDRGELVPSEDKEEEEA